MKLLEKLFWKGCHFFFGHIVERYNEHNDGEFIYYDLRCFVCGKEKL